MTNFIICCFSHLQIAFRLSSSTNRVWSRLSFIFTSQVTHKELCAVLLRYSKIALLSMSTLMSSVFQLLLWQLSLHTCYLESLPFYLETCRFHRGISRSQYTISTPFAWGHLGLQPGHSFECSHCLYIHLCKKTRHLLTSMMTYQHFANFHEHQNNLGGLLKFILLSSNPRGSDSANRGRDRDPCNAVLESACSVSGEAIVHGLPNSTFRDVTSRLTPGKLTVKHLMTCHWTLDFASRQMINDTDFISPKTILSVACAWTHRETGPDLWMNVWNSCIYSATAWVSNAR